MATIFIQNPTSSELTITDNSLYDIIILSQRIKKFKVKDKKSFKRNYMLL